MIETPYSGDIDRNVRYLLLCMAEAGMLYNELPYATHSYMTQHPRCKTMYVSDYDPKWNVWTRESAIEAGQRMRHRCDRTVFYIDLGWSNGMKAALVYCQLHGLPYEIRRLNYKNLEWKIPFMSEEFSEAIINLENYEHMLE